jgi:7-cyano-7-deazaguanine synthase
MKVIVILSGGMDSATVLAHACGKYGRSNVLALTFDYGQRHRKEIDAARGLAAYYGIQHQIFSLDLTQIGGSALTDKDIDVPEFEKDAIAMERTGVAITYVPMRNTIFISLAAAYAESLGYQRILTGMNYIDAGGYPDCRPEYVAIMNAMLAVGSRDKPYVEAPLINMTKADIVKYGQELRVPWHLTWSCYNGQRHPCGACNACQQRAKGFSEAKVVDPLVRKVEM